MQPALSTGDSRDARWGLGLVFLSTIAYGTLPIFTKIAYAEGLHMTVLLALRFSIAAVFFEVMARRDPSLPLKLRLGLWALGGVFLCDTFFYFKALETLSAAETALIFYIYPVVVTLLSAALGIEALTFRGLAAAVLSFSGAALTVAPSGAGREMRGILFALIGSCMYAVFIVLASRFAVPAQTAARHIAEVGALVWIILALAHGDVQPPTPLAWGTIIGIAFFCTVVAHAAFLGGLARVGPGRASVVSSLEVVVTVILALVVLKEKVGLRPFIGGALILLAVWVQARAPRAERPKRPSAAGDRAEGV